MHLKNFWANFMVTAGALGALGVPFFLEPDPRGLGTHEKLFLPPCPFHWLTDLPCPTCGLTTSFAYLTQGQWLRAFEIHSLGPLFFLLILMLLGLTLYAWFKRKPFWFFFENKNPLLISTTIITLLFIHWTVKIFLNEKYFISVLSQGLASPQPEADPPLAGPLGAKLSEPPPHRRCAANFISPAKAGGLTIPERR